MNETDLRTVVESVRERLAAADLSTAHGTFRSFPRGACGATCDVLATVLERRFGVVPYWVGAEVGHDDGSHAWLEVEGFIIDITADQFGQEPIIVTRHSDWHQSLDVRWRDHFPMSERNWGTVGYTVWHLISDLAAPTRR